MIPRLRTIALEFCEVPDKTISDLPLLMILETSLAV